MLGPAAAAFPCRLLAERPGGDRSMAPAVAAVLEQLRAHLGRELCWHVGDERAAPRRVATDASALEPLIAQAVGPAGPFVPFILADDPRTWDFVLGVTRSEVPERLEAVDLSLPGAREPQPLGLKGMMALVGDVTAAFGAPAGVVEDAAVAAMFHGQRAHERALAGLPPQFRDQVPPFEPIPGVAGALPALLLAADVDRSRVPAAVYWINAWCASIVDTLGRARVEQAGWAHVERGAAGSLVLAATAAPPDLTSASDVSALTRIVERLELRPAQERHRRTDA